MSDRDALLQLLEQRADIGGRFFDIRRIPGAGVGAFSALVSADDRASSCRVAVKVCLPFQETYRDESFDREADILESLHDEPDIIQLVSGRAEFTEVLTAQGGLKIPWKFRYYALELASSDIGAVIAGAQWDAERMLIAFRSMCRAVQRIHSRLIAHRDLKPSNLLVMRDGSVKLSDFGTARRIDSTTPALVGSYSGPPGDRRYCAPEMLACLHDEDPSVAFRADIYSLGSVLFEMFSGTILGLRLFNRQFWTDIAQAMLAVKVGQRRTTYDQIVSSIANSRPLPSVAAFGTSVPACIRDRVDDLYRHLAAIDYRRRLTEFDRIFNRVNTCLLILRNEKQYQRWLEAKRRRRAEALARINGVRL